jgi:hypothetical protein
MRAHSFLVALLASSAAAQFEATLTARIDRAPATRCNATATHVAGCTNVLLKSSAVNLEENVGRVLHLRGRVQLGWNCVTIDVADATPANERTTAVALFGYRLGMPVAFTTLAPVGALVPFFFGARPGFLPLGALGTLLLDPFSTQYFTTDISIGATLRVLRIPNDPSLVGVQIYYQTAWAQVTPSLEGTFLNPGCFQITQ